ncbi:VOC family protein [Streptomyces sp. TP-A0874]|uniref:VOC family protein n=1 Tax=Streptomyces sp. TP-A0874 TaxID=549819 RepID=UPI000853B726|nr:glyoxalase [Streptomyces sp. TP-A0874]
MEIMGTSLRVCVADLPAAVAVYERLTGERAQRFDRGAVSVAAVGPFLLMSGPPAELEVLRKVAATIAVQDVAQAAGVLTEVGAQILAGPMGNASGRTLLARHPDGSIFEYVDRGEPAR